MGYAEDVEDYECHGEEQGGEENAEAGRDADQFEQAEFVFGFDVVEEVAGGEEPPGIAEEGFVGAGGGEDGGGVGEVELKTKSVRGHPKVAGDEEVDER